MRVWILIGVCCLSGLVSQCRAQAVPTAVEPVRFAVFALANYTDAGIADTRSLGATVGADLSFTPGGLSRFVPALEARGTASEAGKLSSLREDLVGPRLSYWYGGFHPYADVLVGRGRVQYLDGGVIFGERVYVSSITTVYSPGGGLDVPLSHSLTAKLDAQYQFWRVPVVATGAAHPLALSVGVVYQFDFNQKVKE